MSLVRAYISKSSLEKFGNCENSYYLSYSLGYREPPRKRTIIGSALHAVMEVISLVKIEIQNGKIEGVVNHEELGEIPWDKISYDLPSLLTNEEVDKVNSSRKNKQTYKSECKLSYGAIRYGREFINSLIERSWEFCLKQDVSFWNKPWMPVDKVELFNFCWMSLEQYPLRDKKIIAVEKQFDLPIVHESCKLENGEYVKMKGFIDLIVEVAPNILEVLDFKTGVRSNLYTGEEYTLGYFSKDIQLCMYRFAVKRLYPGVKEVITSISYIRDGGTFSCAEIDNHDEYIFEVVRSHVEELKNCKQPTVFSEDREDFRCKHICYFAKKKTFSDTKCDCEVIRDSVRENGLDYTTLMYHKENYPNS